MERETLRIGEVAAGAGVNVETLRFYERRGLLKEPKRDPSSGYRGYPLEAVRLVKFIKRAQELGFTLKEVGELLRLRESQGATCAEVRAAARSKLEDIDRRVKTLQAMRRVLLALHESCTSNGSIRHCPIIESIERADRKGRAK